MTCHFIRWAGTDALHDPQHLPDGVIATAQELPAWRRERYLKSRALLAEMMFYFFGYPRLPALTLSPNERPHFIDSYLPDFSLAYTGNTLIILLSEEGQVEIDIEIVHFRPTYITSSPTQSQTSAENAWINAQSDPLEAVTELYTIRQAIMKMTEPGVR
ncbi:MAG: 4'-phosphopantetheinyl transferase family protein [Candidatus Malihini olakiniferum]